MNQELATFDPNWISPPGATILDILVERNYTIAEFTAVIHRSSYDVAQLLTGATRLTPDWADHLVETIGGSKDFWLRREEQYRRDIVRLSADADYDCMSKWLAELPVKDMIHNHWIEQACSVHEEALNVLAFFGVPSIEAWRHTYSKTLKAAAFRTTSAYEVHPGAEAAWLRHGEIRACALDCTAWNKDTFIGGLPRIRELTRESDPLIFLPKLEAICAAAGVALVIEKAPEGCRAGGATKFITKDKALMLLSFRYLSDDQFWFTVFHEAGHLILHTDMGLFLEGPSFETTVAESEADNFARHQLFPNNMYDELACIPLNKYAIAKFARRAGVSPGIVVGHLQGIGLVPYKHFNYMKARYCWAE